MTYRQITLLLAIALAACQSSEPAPMGKDRYMLSGTGAWGGWSSGTAIKGDLYRQATEFCQRQGKQMVPGPAGRSRACWPRSRPCRSAGQVHAHAAVDVKPARSTFLSGVAVSFTAAGFRISNPQEEHDR